MPLGQYPQFFGPTYNSRAMVGFTDHCMNLYPEFIESGTGKDRMALIGTPGLKKFCNLGGQIRGLFSNRGIVLAVAGATLYRLYEDGSAMKLGEVEGGDTGVTFADNGSQICIAGPARGYILQGTTLTAIPEDGLPAISHVQFLDQYFIGLEPKSRNIYISGQLDGLTWNPADYKVRETAPDNVVAIIEDHGELLVLGDQKSEFWYNSGNVDFPFDRIANARLEMGCIAPYSPAKMDNSIFWLGKDERGYIVVWRATGYTAARVSTHAQELYLNRIAQYASKAVGWTYQEEGHSFYVLTFPDLPPDLGTTWVYDAATQMWHERFYWEKIHGRMEPHRARCHCFAFNKHLVGDRSNGKIYEQKLDYYDDAGDRIRRIRVTPHICSQFRWQFFETFQIDMEVAIGLGVIPTSIYGPDMFGQEYEQG